MLCIVVNTWITTPTIDCKDITSTATGHSSVVALTPYLTIQNNMKQYTANFENHILYFAGGGRYFDYSIVFPYCQL